jgi:signal transduction histidine kinase
VSAAVTLAGWVVAAGGAAAAVGARRLLGTRMESVARACHELRGPLTAARLGLELGLRGGLSPARARAIDLELGRAAVALDDLADLGRIGSASPCVVAPAAGHLDARELVADSIEAWRAAASAAGVELRMTWSGGAATVVAERFRLAQATGNLIANAIEHGGGAVEVRGRVERSAVRIEVTDEGPGLSAPLPELVSRARRRRRSGDRSRGHGLAVAAAVAVAHGGRLAAAPSERGARFVLELPVAGERISAPRGGR